MARYFEVRIDEANEHHVTQHGVSAREITQVFCNDPAIHRNRRARTGDYIALGVTDGGRRILVIFSFTDDGGVDRSPHGSVDEQRQRAGRHDRRTGCGALLPAPQRDRA